MDDNHEHERGPALEERVHQLLRELEAIGLVANIRKPDQVKDWHGNTRRLDMSFSLRSVGVHVLVNVECKSRERTITIDQIDQIKTFKNDVVGRNIFWLVYEGMLSETVEKTLADCGMSFYSIERFEKIIRTMVENLNERSDELKSLIAAMEPFRAFDAGLCGMCANEASRIVVKTFPASTGRFVNAYTGPESLCMLIDGNGYEGTWLVDHRFDFDIALPKKEGSDDG